MKFTEAELQGYAAPLSDIADYRCKQAITQAKEAMALLGYYSLLNENRLMFSESFSYFSEMRNDNNNREIKIFIQGSYANKTNINCTSDVDIAVLTESSFIPKYNSRILLESTYPYTREDVMRKKYNFSKSHDNVHKLKDDVEAASRKKFGSPNVHRKNKCIKVDGNSTRTDADLVPALRHKDFSLDESFNPYNFIGGIYIYADDGEKIVNYPEQHINNGVTKDRATAGAFKKNVRIIKNIKEVMYRNKIDVAEIASFVLESLLWNVPNSIYGKHSNILGYNFYEIIQWLNNNSSSFGSFMEANGIKMLFTDSQKQMRYKQFIDNLCNFYQYDIQE